MLRVLAKLGPFELMDVADEVGCARYVQGPITPVMASAAGTRRTREPRGRMAPMTSTSLGCIVGFRTQPFWSPD